MLADDLPERIVKTIARQFFEIDFISGCVGFRRNMPDVAFQFECSAIRECKAAFFSKVAIRCRFHREYITIGI